MANDSKRVTYVCSQCGSTNVISDTRSSWDVSRQAWIVEGHYDSAECLDCEQEQRLIEVELAPAA
jgi:DNA-directed RNA polymerase subunit RPC12/RpoP